MSETTRKSLRRRLQPVLRYHAWMWYAQTPKERYGYVWRLLWTLPFIPLSLFLRGVLLLFDLDAKRGAVTSIKILDSAPESAPTFLRVTTEALHLIQQVDPRRFRRIQREVRWVENYPQWAVGSYERRTRKCKIKFSSLPCTWADPTAPEYQWYLFYYATVLVHEATHGHFYSLGIPYMRGTRVDIERLCVEEAHRFAVRLFPEDRQRADVLVPPFDAGQWQQYWQQSLWQWTRSTWQAGTKVFPERERK